MNDIEKARERKHRAEAVRRLESLDMPEVIIDQVYGYLVAVRGTIEKSDPSARHINPIEFVDVATLGGGWVFSSTEGCRHFRLEHDAPEPTDPALALSLATFSTSTFTDKAQVDLKADIEAFLQTSFWRWVAVNNAKFRNPDLVLSAQLVAAIALITCYWMLGSRIEVHRGSDDTLVMYFAPGQPGGSSVRLDLYPDFWKLPSP